MKSYWMTPTTQDPRQFTGLSPTFIIFMTTGGTFLTAPAITEPGVSTGLYNWQYGTTQSIVFTIDAGSAVSAANRYITGTMDPVDAVDEKIGFGSDSFGSTLTDPSTLFGFAKRAQETAEGNANFNKSTQVWSVSSRGSSTLLFTKTLSNTASEANKA